MLLFLIGTTFAQTPHAEFGIKAGVNTSKFNQPNMNTIAGVNAGAFAHVHFTRHFALQPEVVYSQQGTQYANNETQRVNYVNIPVLGQLMFGRGFRFETGPQLGLRTNATIKNGNHESSNDNSYNNTDFAWAFGAGFISPVGLGIDARYNLGITDITRGASDIKNRVFQIGLFYQFR